MAEVVDLAGNSPYGPGFIDQRLARPNRANAGTPVGTLTPAYPGEIVSDTTNRQLWRGNGTSTNDWYPITKSAE